MILIRLTDLLHDVSRCGYHDCRLFAKGKQDDMPFSLFVIPTDRQRDGKL
jgi:hypothetical protein